MTGDPLLANALAWWAQAACLTALGALLASIIRIDAASVRYAYWRVLLVLCLALPLLQGRSVVNIAAATPSAETPAVFSGTADLAGPAEPLAAPAATQAVADVDWLRLLALVIAAVAVMRLLWIGISLLRLHRLRSAGEAVADDEVLDAQWTVGAYADIRYVAGLKQPVTFGWRQPVVLLPDTLRQHPDAIQRAVLCHELFHVKRGDWAWLVAEEAVRSVLWFHPAAWWLVSRIQLAREEVVDELTVLATGRRRAYVEALLAFADEPLASVPAPSPQRVPALGATAFARRRHLFRRMVLVSKEAAMSAQRVLVSSAALMFALAAGVWSMASAFPLVAAAPAPHDVALPAPAGEQVVGGLEVRSTPGPLEQKARPITAENPIPRRRASAPAAYPAAAEPTQARGVVSLRVTLDSSGRVAEVRRVGATAGDAVFDAFTASAVDALSQWQYDPPAQAPITFDVNFSFQPNLESAIATQGGGGRAAGVGAGAGAAAGAGIAGGVPGTVIGGVGGRIGAPAPGSAGSAAAQDANQPLRVGGAIKQPLKTKHVNPEYPPIAQSARVQGVVIVEAVIGADGRVGDVRVLRSIPLLDQAAVNAVRQWEFTPTLLNGQPVSIVMTMTVQFTLPEVAPAQQ